MLHLASSQLEEPDLKMVYTSNVLQKSRSCSRADHRLAKVLVFWGIASDAVCIALSTDWQHFSSFSPEKPVAPRGKKKGKSRLLCIELDYCGQRAAEFSKGWRSDESIRLPPM